MIKHKANTLYQKVVNDKIKISIKNRCCDFKSLERCLDNWNQKCNDYGR